MGVSHDKYEMKCRRCMENINLVLLENYKIKQTIHYFHYKLVYPLVFFNKSCVIKRHFYNTRWVGSY